MTCQQCQHYLVGYRYNADGKREERGACLILPGPQTGKPHDADPGALPCGRARGGMEGERQEREREKGGRVANPARTTGRPKKEKRL